MQRAFALVEGRTEETFVNQVLQPHLEGRGLWVRPVVLTTKRTAAGHKMSGGVSTWSKIERDLRNLLGDTDVVAVTTLLDYHAFPGDAPGMADRPAGGPERRVAHVEAALASELADRRFLPYLSLHEFEALVLSAPNVVAGHLCSNPGLRQQLDHVVSRYGGAEQVNETVHSVEMDRARVGRVREVPAWPARHRGSRHGRATPSLPALRCLGRAVGGAHPRIAAPRFAQRRVPLGHLWGTLATRRRSSGAARPPEGERPEISQGRRVRPKVAGCPIVALIR